MRLLKRIQRDAYLIQRAAGDADAAQRGGDVLAKRLLRRKLTALAFRRWR